MMEQAHECGRPPAATSRPESEGASVQRLARGAGPSLELLVRRPSGSAKGAPVLFLHGAFAGAWCWEERWLGHFAGGGRHAAALSLRGHGGSEGRETVGWAAFADFVADLLLAVRAMPAPPVVVAHSFGGLVAQHLLGPVATGALALRGLVLVGSLPPEGLSLVLSRLGLSAWTRSDHVGFGPGPAFAGRDALFGTCTAPAAAAAYAARMGEAAALGLAQALIPFPIAPAWAVGVPALVLHGADDRLVDPTTALRTALYHGAACEHVAGAGHFPMLGRHATAAAEAVCRWLDGHGV